MDAQPILNELLASGFTLFIDGDLLKVSPASNLTDELRQKIRAHKAELLEALRAEEKAERLEDYTELFHERAAVVEYDGGLSRDQAEELAIRTVWRWRLKNGDGGTLHCNAITYEQARKSLEEQFRRKLTHLEFISAMVNGVGFVPFSPALH